MSKLVFNYLQFNFELTLIPAVRAQDNSHFFHIHKTDSRSPLQTQYPQKLYKLVSQFKTTIAMSVPALRQPKKPTRQPETKKKTILPDVQYVIVTLIDHQKLVVSSDAYHGIITVGEMYKCVFCRAEMELDPCCKERHIKSAVHRKVLEKYPHVEEYSKNLIRELTKDSSFCTICNVVIVNVHLMHHLHAEVHRQELEKAEIRAVTYKPY